MIILITNIIILFLLFQNISIDATPSWRRFYDVENLSAEPDYRAVKLRWNYYNEEGLTGFKVKFCEISAWNSKIRCRERHLQLLTQLSRKVSREESSHDILLDKVIRLNRGSFEASIYDLRMLTNYTFNIRADFDSSGSYGLSSHPFYSKNPADSYRPHTSITDYDDYQRNVIVETKSFSARTSRCLANTSDVIVNTGPYFSGKIAVEDAYDNRCSVYGNRSSTQNVYTLTILHDVCGSKIINNSRIETMVMVHENREILTHNSRRFLVVCNFVPETFTLTASVAVPTHLLKRKFKTEENQSHSIENNVIPSKPNTNSESETINESINERSNDIFTFDHYKQHNVRDSRMLAHEEHRIVNNNHVKAVTDQYWNQIYSTILFVISGLIFCVIALLWFSTTPQISDKNKKLETYISMESSSASASPSIEKKLNQNNAILSINGSPIALVSIIDSLGESYA